MPQRWVGSTSGQKGATRSRIVFLRLHRWSKRIVGKQPRTHVFSTPDFSFFAGAGEYLLNQGTHECMRSSTCALFPKVRLRIANERQESGHNQRGPTATKCPSRKYKLHESEGEFILGCAILSGNNATRFVQDRSLSATLKSMIEVD